MPTMIGTNLPNPQLTVTAGDGITFLGTFLNSSGVPTDPSTVTLYYGNLGEQPIEVPQGSLTHVDAGEWQYEADTTSFGGTDLVFMMVGTGAVPKILIGVAIVENAPFGFH